MYVYECMYECIYAYIYDYCQSIVIKCNYWPYSVDKNQLNTRTNCLETEKIYFLLQKVTEKSIKCQKYE